MVKQMKLIMTYQINELLMEMRQQKVKQGIMNQNMTKQTKFM